MVVNVFLFISILPLYLDGTPLFVAVRLSLQMVVSYWQINTTQSKYELGSENSNQF